MNQNVKRGLAVAGVAGTLFMATSSPASAGRTWAGLAMTQNHTDPCPGSHITVYNEESNVELPHFVCGTGGAQGPKGDTGAQGPKGDTGAQGPKGDTGAQGPKGDTGAQGADSTVPGPMGLPGLPGLDSTVAGPKGSDGLPGVNGMNGQDGAASTVPGPTGAAGADGKSIVGATGKAGKDGVSKTVIVHADGTQEVVSNLPKTGGHVNWGLIGAGSALVATGIGMVLVIRRRQSV